MKDYIEKRVMDIAEYILTTGATVRGCAKHFDISKTTVHKDMRERLPELNPRLAEDVGSVLQVNKADRHIRGGDATRKKYLKRKSLGKNACL